MELKVKGRGIETLVRSLRVRVSEKSSYGVEIYSTVGIEGQEFDVVAIGMHTYEDNSQEAVAWLATPEKIREVALSRLIVVKMEPR